MEYDSTGSAPGWWALTGTPGTGKSTVARALVPELFALELRDLAAGFTASRPASGPVLVDLPRIARWMRRHVPPAPVVLSGYLSHRLPVEGAIVLRCHPAQLLDRLERRGGPRDERRENVQCEALDTIAGEARAERRPVWEIDTTGASPRNVARRVRDQVLNARGTSDRVDWLADPTVPPLLLRLAR
jgi:adenylate kinase